MLELPPLPYAEDALAPHVSAETLSFHYGKHHKSYVEKANGLIEGTELAGLELVPLIRKVAGDASQKSLFNNAAQVWNHDFYWNSMSPKGGGRPKGALAERIDADLGGYEKFAETFKKTAMGQFGSGYCWLVLSGGKLKIYSTANAETPIAGKKDVPILTTDVWEHTYYLDYQNKRQDYLDAFLDHLVNWEFAAANFEKADLQTA
ncbi:Superoxide dismutase [Parvibaculum lavamentivorans DS-1]|uniref:Superoxide dismutase n=1 Tax=Parvibaculum lavamentivorans (strain DS-1 / DSM 13023 / NCIMB 13966) TaxID=402881 RepID=A7HPH7_PARL1|nr:superoxide dismutase [Parvibaculum lavamentivorans]ABS61810.1 Superoxide dismutase [Parvibaculum lavamentivorans DS-1]